MIRRLILFRDMTEGDARSATAWAEKLGDPSLVVAYRPSPVPMRLLLFDGVHVPGKPRRERVRLLPRALDEEGPPARALRYAMETGEVVFNVFTGIEDDPSHAYLGTDATFTIAFPDGDAVAFFRRVSSGIAPGIAASCAAAAFANNKSPIFIRRPAEWELLREAVRHLFFKNPPIRLEQDQQLVMETMRGLLDEVPTGD